MSWEIDWIDSKARLMPNVDAIIDAKQNRAWTYQEVNLRAVALASWFKKMELKKAIGLPSYPQITLPTLISCLLVPK